METLGNRDVRRLALARSGLLRRRWTGLPRRASGRGARPRRAAHAVISRFGYLQLDTIAVAGARSHSLVLVSRLDGFDPTLGEELLAPGEPLFEYWGHEASWLPIDLYPTFGFRRREYRHHPWWGDVLGEHPEVADEVLARVERDGPIRTAELAGRNPGIDSWYPKVAKRVALALWSRGDLAIRERRRFQRLYDLAERVIPEPVRTSEVPRLEAVRTLLLRALDGFGWAQTGSLAATWRLKNMRPEIESALDELESAGEIVACRVEGADGGRYTGWTRPEHLELAERLGRARPRPDRGILLSPFDPLVWERTRTERLFGFHHVMEFFKPVAERRYGYYSMPVVAGDRLVARVDLEADRDAGRLTVANRHFEREPAPTSDREAVRSALARHAAAVGMTLRQRGSDVAQSAGERRALPR